VRVCESGDGAGVWAPVSAACSARARQLVLRSGAASRVGWAAASTPAGWLSVLAGSGPGAAAAADPVCAGWWRDGGGAVAGLLARQPSSPGRIDGARDAAHVRLYLKPYLGSVLLSELTVGQAQAMSTAITRRHEAEGHPVTPATLARIRATPQFVMDT
jgi:hypothetical protein